jgi:hypothetical protein
MVVSAFLDQKAGKTLDLRSIFAYSATSAGRASRLWRHLMLQQPFLLG